MSVPLVCGDDYREIANAFAALGEIHPLDQYSGWRPWFQTEIDGEVAPTRIVSQDQHILFLTSPALDLFLSGDGIADVMEDFVNGRVVVSCTLR